jgi:hypothetical protein
MEERGVILLTQYPCVGDQKRQTEFDNCLSKNLENPHFSRVALLQEPGVGVPRHQKIDLWHVDGRLTYKVAVAMAATYYDEICVLANADIMFDDSIYHIIEKDLRNTVVCLSRDDAVERQFEGQSAGAVSQDVWIFNSPLRGVEKMWLDFQLGRPGCDNRFAYELEQHAGYKLVNPAKLIKVTHVHAGPPNWDESRRVPKPYVYVPVTETF